MGGNPAVAPFPVVKVNDVQATAITGVSELDNLHNQLKSIEDQESILIMQQKVAAAKSCSVYKLGGFRKIFSQNPET